MNKDAAMIVRRLRDHGHEAYLVGGCVRDMLMGEEPKDWDVATSARPDEVQGLFKKTMAVGAQFGVMIVRVRNKNYEVATFREEWGYEDGRHPSGVRFSSAKADAMRRDFTINGLFYDPVNDKVIDFVGGRKDLERGLVRAIGDPEERFFEDKLRMLRAVRFAARFNYSLDKDTGRAIKEHAPEICDVSAERLRDEVLCILQGERPALGVRMMDQYGLLDALLPEVAAMKGVQQPPEFHPEGDVFTHTMIMLESMRKKYKQRPEFVMAVLLHDVGKPATFKVAERIRFDNHTEVGARISRQVMRRLRFGSHVTSTVEKLVQDHLKFMNVPEMRQSTLKRLLRMDDFELHLELHRLDCKASHGNMSTYRLCRRKLRELSDEQELRPERLITGNDLIELGLSPGPEFRRILSAVEDAQLEGGLNTKEEAIAWVKRNVTDKE